MQDCPSFPSLHRIGYTDVAAIQGVLASLVSATDEKKHEDEPAKQQIAFVDHKPSSVEEEAWYLPTGAITGELDVPQVDEGGRWSPVPFSIKTDSESSSSAIVQMTSIDIMVIDDSRKQERPLLILSADLEATASGFGSDVQPIQVRNFASPATRCREVFQAPTLLLVAI